MYKFLLIFPACCLFLCSKEESNVIKKDFAIKEMLLKVISKFEKKKINA